MSDVACRSLFHGRVGVLATMHQKEQVIAPILAESLGVQITVPQDFNTDQFGTFTRDIKRAGDQLNAARLKAEKVLDLTGLTLAIASEGSFGPHPSLPFLACDVEVVLLCDRTHDLEVVGQAISTQTNYSSQQVTSVESALTFAQTIGFPTHGLVAMPSVQAIADAPTPSALIFKGITDKTQLLDIVTELLKKFGHAHLETDMRAMHNPTRMAVIAQATHDLIQKINQCCPQCHFPGFAVVDRKAGLPCELCRLPTQLTLAITHHCKKCDFRRVTPFPEGRSLADPSHCLYCNP
jgi:hypothetical protein